MDLFLSKQSARRRKTPKMELVYFPKPLTPRLCSERIKEIDTFLNSLDYIHWSLYRCTGRGVGGMEICMTYAPLLDISKKRKEKKEICQMLIITIKGVI
jgi:hypothetical protein